MAAKLTAEQIADKVFQLTEQFNHFVFAHPEILDRIPDQAMLVFLDPEDPAFNEANLALVNATPPDLKQPKVYIQMHKHIRVVEQIEWSPHIIPASQIEFA